MKKLASSEAWADDGLVDEAPVVEAPRARLCLRCRTSFESHWSGERICPDCKRSVAWRKGAPLRAHAVARQR